MRPRGIQPVGSRMYSKVNGLNVRLLSERRNCLFVLSHARSCCHRTCLNIGDTNRRIWKAMIQRAVHIWALKCEYENARRYPAYLSPVTTLVA